MFKLLLLLALLASVAFGNELVEMYATKVDVKDNLLVADGEVVIMHKEYFLTSKSAIYDKVTGELELFGNIRATQGADMKLLGDYAKMNVNAKERTFKPFYMLEEKSQVWFSGKESYAKENELEIKSGVVSGCNPHDPLWKIAFSSSDYDTESMWLNLYNARIYLYDFPVFYTPYFGYSLDTTRRTGLLPPMVGISSDEGFYYEQPFYIAEQNWWDLELRPQIRTSRGEGMYTTFRFVDSNTSKGSLTAGFFNEKAKYAEENNLANNKHYGFNFLYSNKNVLNDWLGTNLSGQSGLYADISNMNDVDYINLSSNNQIQTATAKQIISRVNLFYNTSNDYFGAYLKYYKDLSLESNEATIQTLPTIQYHHYIDTFLQNHFSYSFDIQSNNYERKVGKTAMVTDVNIPLTLQTSILDDYINLSYKMNLYAQHMNFGGKEETPTTTEYENGFFGRNYHTFSASSQTTKAYDSFTHTLDIGAQYVTTGASIENGYYNTQKDYCSDATHATEEICQYYNITDVKENLQLFFSQYFYDQQGRQVIYHKLAQNFDYSSEGNSAGDLENELDWQIASGINYYNNSFYNYDQSAFSKNFNRVSFANSVFNVNFSHMYENKFIVTIPKTNYFTSSIGYRYNEHYSYSARYDYDLELSIKKGAELGFLYQKRCWDFGIKYIENNRPILTSGGLTDSIYDKFIYFTIRLKPFMPSDGKGSGFVYKLPKENS